MSTCKFVYKNHPCFFVCSFNKHDSLPREKSVVNEGLARNFPDIIFEESDSELDHAGDIDYVAKVDDKAFGIQIKSVTAKANFGNYSPTKRMKNNFAEFEEQYGGKVFIVFETDVAKLPPRYLAQALKRRIDTGNVVLVSNGNPVASISWSEK